MPGDFFSVFEENGPLRPGKGTPTKRHWVRFLVRMFVLIGFAVFLFHLHPS
jgi:hypothetical protein